MEGDIDPVDLLLDDFERAEQVLLANQLRDVESPKNVLDFLWFSNNEVDDDCRLNSESVPATVPISRKKRFVEFRLYFKTRLNMFENVLF